LSVGPTGPNQKAKFVKFSLSVNFVVLIRVALDPNPRKPRNGSRILENDTDPYGSGSATIIKGEGLFPLNIKVTKT
jgi:hypothetical protein